MSDELKPLREWDDMWGICVAAVDFESARSLFAKDVVSFGTHATFFVSGIDALQDGQWSKVWPKISDFEFLTSDLIGAINDDAAWAAVPWASTGYHEDGSSFDRPGRATVTYRREGPKWLGTHTHFSLRPGVPPQSFGKP
jgi:ketosteroid isomerase-like protein